MTSADAVALARQSISAGSPPMGGGLHRWWDTASQSPPSPPPPVTRLVSPLALHASIPWWWRNAVVRLPPPPPPRTVRRGCWRARNKDTAWQLRQGGPPRPPPLSVEPTSPRLPPPHARAWCAVGGGCRRVWSLAARARAASTHPPACLLQGGGDPLWRAAWQPPRWLASANQPQPVRRCCAGRLWRGGGVRGEGLGRVCCVRVCAWVPVGHRRPLRAVRGGGCAASPGGSVRSRPSLRVPRALGRPSTARRSAHSAHDRPPPSHQLPASTTGAVAAVTVAAATTTTAASPLDSPVCPRGTTTAPVVTIAAPLGFPWERLSRARNRRPTCVRA